MNWEWLRLPQIPNISLLPFEISKSVLSYLLRWILRRYINVDTFPDNIDDAIVLENKSLNSRVRHALFSPPLILHNHSQSINTCQAHQLTSFLLNSIGYLYAFHGLTRSANQFPLIWMAWTCFWHLAQQEKKNHTHS